MDENHQPLLEYVEDDSEEDVHRVTNGIQLPIPINDRPLFKQPEPKDKYHAVYFLFLLLGITSLLPWSFFVTANNYWMYKFRDAKDHLVSTKLTPLQASFTSYLSIASNLPNLLFLIINAVFNDRFSFRKRIIGSLFILLLLFIVTTVFVNINTDLWEQKFLIFTLCSVVLMNCSCAILTSSVIGMMGKFSTKYITAVISGQALSGTFAAVAQIISLAIGASSTHSAFIYFMIGNFTILLTLISFMVLSDSVFYKFYMADKMGVGLNELASDSVNPTIISYKTITKKIWPQCLSCFLVFFVTLSVCPGVAVLIQSEGNSKFSEVFFVPVVTYLLMSLGDYAGRVTGGLLQWPRSGLILNVFNLMRLVFIPLILFCNVQPRGSWPVLFGHDYYYITFMVLLGLTNGYIANVTTINVPKLVDHHEKDTAMLILAIALGFGVTIGSFLSAVFVKYM